MSKPENTTLSAAQQYGGRRWAITVRVEFAAQIPANAVMKISDVTNDLKRLLDSPMARADMRQSFITQFDAGGLILVPTAVLAGFDPDPTPMPTPPPSVHTYFPTPAPEERFVCEDDEAAFFETM